MSEIDMTDTAARGLESYRDRLQRFLLDYLEERMDRVEDHLDKDRSKQDSNLNYVLIAITLINLVLWIKVYFQFRQIRPSYSNPSATTMYMSPPVSPVRDQSVPSRGDSLERVEQALMDASPLLLFDPETNIVEGIYSTPSPATIHSEEEQKPPVDS
jgi:cytoskeletal protein RodZ